MTPADAKTPSPTLEKAKVALAEAPPPKPRKPRKPRARKKAPAPETAKAPMVAAAPSRAAPAAAAEAPAQSLSQVAMDQSLDDLAKLSLNMTAAMTRANQIFSLAFIDHAKEGPNWRPDPFDVQGALGTVWSRLAGQPETLRDAHAQLWQRYAQIWERHAAYMITGQQAAEAPARDKRFKDPEWRSNPAFSMMRDTYLATSDFITSLVEQAEGVDDLTKRKAAFFIKQAVDAASPSNFLMTNPAALRELFNTHGESLVKGMDNFAHDMERGHGGLAITQVDRNAFKVGVNIAATPGKVIFRNRVLELIQYQPTTETVYQTPLLIFPPWINKFYILDLQPKNSMIKWLVDQGFTVVIASWANPDESMSEMTFEDYMREGIYAATEAVKQACDVEQIHAVGYCVAGTLLSTTLAHMAKTKEKSIKSATFFASQSDFKLAGDLLVFSDNPGIKYLEDRMDANGGVLDSQAMSDTFNALRSNDLIWSYVVDNYYLGKQPTPFDLLYWNSDQTRMPRALHLFYLRNFYRDNALAEGKLELLGEKLSLSEVKTPVFMQSAKEDHIAPCESVYRGANLFGGPVEFIAAGSGHIAGVVNPPAAHKYQYWTNRNLKGALADWFAFAEEHPGSWWVHWRDWLKAQDDEQIPARIPGDGALPALGEAPGEYVKVASMRD
jgi:polyhydroxyalkanoate synthase